MDPEGQARLSRACRLLLPGPDMDEDESEVVISIRPKSSPLPRRRSSLSDEDSEPELPPCPSRRVSFADAKGLSLVQVKEFDLWDVPNPPGMEFLDGEGIATEEYCLSPLTFQSPLSPEDLLVRVQEQKIELESLELIPGTTTLKGLICVLNMSFHKAVYVRTTLDCWASHFDLLTEYIPASGNAHTDRFSFKLTLVPPFREQGSRVDFCLRYETPMGTFWANNNNRNYVLLCRQRTKEQRETPQKQDVQKKSCLKTVRLDSQSFVDVTSEGPSQGKLSADRSTNGEKVDNEQVVHTPDQSEEDGNNLQAEIRWNCSRRNERKAARMARLKDYFSGTDGILDDKSDASCPQDKKEIPVGDQADVQSWSEEKLKLEGAYGIMEKTLREMPNQQDETQAHNEPQTPEDASLTSLIRGEASTDMSNDEPPPTEHCNTFVSEAEETNDSCRNQSNGFTFETVVTPPYRQMLGRKEDDWTCPEQTEGEDHSTSREVQENLIRKNHQASLKPANWSDKDSVMKSTDNEQEHVMKNTTNDCFDANLNVPLPEKGIRNGAEDAFKSQLSAQRNKTKIRNEMNFPSGVSRAIQNLVRDDVDHQASWGCADWSKTVDSVAQSMENTQSHEHILEDVIENSTKPCFDDTTRNGTQASISLMKSSTNMALPSGGSQTKSQSEPVSHSVHHQASLKPADRSDTEDAVTKSENSPNYENLQVNVTKNSTEECVDTDVNVTLPEDTWTGADSVLDRKCSDQINESQSEPVSDGVDYQAILEHADGSYLQYSVVGSTSISPSESLNHTKVFRDAVTDEPEMQEAATARTALNFLGTQRETCCTGDDGRHSFQEGEALTNEDNAQGVSVLEDEENNLQTVHQDPFSSVETNKAQNCETKVEQGEVNLLQDETEEIQQRPAMQKPDDLEEEIEIACPEAEEPEDAEKEHVEMIFDIVEDIGEAAERFAEMQKSKPEVEMWEEEEVNDEDGVDAVLGGQERAVDPGYKEQKLPGDDAEGIDDVMRSEFDQNKLTDEYLSYLHEADGAAEDPAEQNPDDKTVTRDESQDEPCVFAEQPDSDGASAESDSDDEVELYMHCLRAAQTKDQSAKASFILSKRPSLSRSKPLSSPMPSISESVDEEHVGCHQVSREDAQADNAAQSRPSELESTSKTVARRQTCSCSAISKMMMYVTLLAVFVVMAYYYDFLACFGLYMISVVWLLCQGEKQPIKDNSVG